MWDSYGILFMHMLDSLSFKDVVAWLQAKIVLEIVEVCPVVLVHLLRIVHDCVRVSFRVPRDSDAKVVAMLCPVSMSPEILPQNWLSGKAAYEIWQKCLICSALPERCSLTDLMYLTRSSALANPPSTAWNVAWPFGGSPRRASTF